MAADVQEEVRKVQDLIERKNRIEEEIKELHDVLESQNGVGMTGNLVDNEDYPRQDIDVYTVRVARNKIICLQNDHKALMKQIEEGLHHVHAAAREKKKLAGESQTTGGDTSDDEQSTPFLTVDHVSPGSPAEKAGLQLGDRIVKFGSVNAENFQNMQNIASVVQHSKGQSLGIILRRANNIYRLSLTPSEWPGRGLLGCNIVPLKNATPK